MSSNPYAQHLDKRAANYQPLTPLTVPGARRRRLSRGTSPSSTGRSASPMREFYARARRLASALAARGIGPGDTVSVMLANTPPMLEAHYGVPMTGAVLHSINTRLDAAIVAFQLDHADAKVVICDREFAPVMREALALAKVKPLVIDYDDREFPQAGRAAVRHRLRGVPRRRRSRASAGACRADEWEAIALNYTSGTTGNPKGVVYHHRGAHLMCYANVVAAGMGRHPVYLWTLPMFHCNGWCFPWTLSVVAGTHVCLRWVRAERHVRCHRRAQGDAPVRGADRHVDAAQRQAGGEARRCRTRSQFVTAAAPPPEAVLAAMAEAGFNVTHVYGLTEVYGPAVVNEWHDDWDALPARPAGGAEGAPGRALSGARGPGRDGPRRP